jgi:hypothetical protein
MLGVFDLSLYEFWKIIFRLRLIEWASMALVDTRTSETGAENSHL